MYKTETKYIITDPKLTDKGETIEITELNDNLIKVKFVTENMKQTDRHFEIPISALDDLINVFNRIKQK